MFDHERLNEILVKYKKAFEQRQWPDEKYKWEAVKRFQDVWDVNADDFGSMLEQSIDKCGNLLASAGSFPGKMIVQFAKARPEIVRSMFIDLFDETRDYYERIADFKTKASDVLRDIHGQDTTLNHYQDENTITTYLWLRFPDRYYIYKYSEVRNVAEELSSDCKIKKGAYASNVRNHLAFYDEICSALKQDEELASLLKANLTPECYPDPELRTLTVDVGFYISRYVHGRAEFEWYPAQSEYDPGLSADDWRNLIGDGDVFTESALEIVRRMRDYGGEATCKQLSSKYGQSANFYLSGSVALAKRVASKTGCPVMPDDAGNSKWWPVLYLGRKAGKDDEGTWVWRLRDELREALGQTGETPVPREGRRDSYSKDKFLDEVYMDEARYEKLRAVLLRKKNVILQGAPGVGKTFCARRLAWSIMGEKDDDRIEFVQFHQSYSYEDFIGGWRPEEDAFAWKPGVFYRFCKKAESKSDKPFFFIIDEINRGNLSRIFGELLMLIEADYRDSAKVTLPYGDAPFSVPGNLYLIGMMNTADRSLAMIDYALRRRFSFFDMEPAFDTEGFTRYREPLKSDTVNELVEKVQELNAAIARDSSLGSGFRIGHSYFCGHDAQEDADEWCLQVVDFDILPMLREYWFDDEDKVTRWDNALHGVFQR